MMRTTRLHKNTRTALATALLCVLASSPALAQTGAAQAEPEAKPSSGFLPPAATSAKVLDSIQVVVNDEVITRNEVANRIEQIKQNMRSRNVQLPDQDTMQRQVVESMIVERAQLQLAKEMGVRVDDRTLDATIGRIAEGQQTSVQEMRNQMEKEGLPFARFREDIRNEIMMQRLREHEVDSKIQISEAEIDTYLAASKAAAADRIEVEISQILVRVPENATPEQVSARAARAEDVLRQLRLGADFVRMASTYSDAPDALKGGEIGWRDADRLPPMFADELRQLEPGQVTSILKTNVGFHILKLTNKRALAAADDDKAIVEQTQARHILIKVTPTMTEAQAKAKLQEFKDKIESKAATFEELARLHSQDGSASRGGDLGWLYPEDVVPDFEKAMNALKPGEVSGVVQTQFGFHLIQVLERKQEDVTTQKERNEARQVLHERKMQEAMETWMREVRDRAYVELREEE